MDDAHPSLAESVSQDRLAPTQVDNLAGFGSARDMGQWVAAVWAELRVELTDHASALCADCHADTIRQPLEPGRGRGNPGKIPTTGLLFGGEAKARCEGVWTCD